MSEMEYCWSQILACATMWPFVENLQVCDVFVVKNISYNIMEAVLVSSVSWLCNPEEILTNVKVFKLQNAYLLFCFPVRFFV
jgi:hypothetical protein